MAIQAKSKVVKFGHGGIHIYVPADVRKDSQNRIHAGDEVIVSIDGERLIVQKIPSTVPVINTQE
ncbi:MAG: AbrB/MazE/SpoVT family DNA-binding domain-containing protein [Candidatus Methanoperedens sp.]|nr:AbrB/MazE/SpoVT family DNA-binding domain-containing protein [Candidatus Methanoperedens sp.]MCE8429075.1 AbrB/MazE/SpoVT family DNA-binding domain-containing protein [Candidatus Methanoperedens sp.]